MTSYRTRLLAFMIPLTVLPILAVALVFFHHSIRTIQSLQFEIMAAKLDNLSERCRQACDTLWHMESNTAEFYVNRSQGQVFAAARRLFIPSGTVFIFDKNGDLLLGDLKTRSAADSFFQKFCQKKTGRIFIENGGKRQLAVVRHFEPWQWTFAAVADESLIFRSVFRSRNITLLVCAGAVLLSLLLMLIFTRSVSEPVQRLTNASERISRGDFDVHVPVTSEDEIGRLARAFNLMAQKLKISTRQLRESEEKLQMVYQTIPDPLTILEMDTGICVDVNRAFTELTGWRPEEVKGKSARHARIWCNPKDRDKMLCQITETGRAENLEAGFYLKNGDTITGLLSACTLFMDGRPHLIAVVRDITERKKAEERLAKSEQRFRALSEAIFEGIVIHDKGRIIQANNRFYKLFGYEPKELEGVNVIPLLTDPDTAGKIQKTISSGVFDVYRARGRKKDGTEFPGEVIQKPVGYRGKTVRMAAVRDLTSYEKYETALRRSEARMRTFLDSSPHAVVVYDDQGRVQYLNSAFTQTFGWSLEDLLGKTIPFVPKGQEETTRQKISELYKTKNPVRLETIRLTKSGETRDILISAAFVRRTKNEPEGIIVNLVDITQQKQMERRLQAALRMESLGTLAGGIAHDFNNLMMGILGNATLIKSHESMEASVLAKVSDIERLIKDGARLTQRLLGFAKGGRYEVSPLDLAELVKNNARTFGRTKKEIQIHEKYSRDIWTVEADRGQLDQVLLNLLVNAWQAMPHGGDLHLALENVTLDENFSQPFVVAPGRYVKLSVTDTGVGMDEQTRRRIFDPFFTTKEMGRGTGLGLASVYGIIKNHNGFITVDSQKGKGSTFNVYLPASQKTPAVRPGAVGKIKTGSGVILLIDDEDFILEVSQKLIEKLGYQVICASSGKKGVEIFAQKSPAIDLVVVDMIMPEMDGGEVYDTLKQMDPNVRVLLSSGYSADGRAKTILDRGCNGFIQKPFNLMELSEKLAGILNA